MIWTTALPYFPRHELACKGTGIIKLHGSFAAQLPALRAQWGQPLQPTSVCRAPEHNANVGGHPTSLHLTDNPKHPTAGTMAADIYWAQWDAGKKLDFAQLAWGLGWSVGLHDTFIHIDRRRDIGLRQAVFLYGRWSGVFKPEEVIA